MKLLSFFLTTKIRHTSYVVSDDDDEEDVTLNLDNFLFNSLSISMCY